MWDKKVFIIGVGCLLHVLNASLLENEFWDHLLKETFVPLGDKSVISSEGGVGEDSSVEYEDNVSSDVLSAETENDEEIFGRWEISDGEENSEEDDEHIIAAKERLKFWQSKINDINGRMHLMPCAECFEGLDEESIKRQLMSWYECSEDLDKSSGDSDKENEKKDEFLWEKYFKALNKNKVASERVACFWKDLIDFFKKDDEDAKRELKKFIGKGNYAPIIKRYLEFYNKTLE